MPRWLRASLLAAALICICAAHVVAQASIHEPAAAAEALRVPAGSWRVPLTRPTVGLLPNVGGHAIAHAGMHSFPFYLQQEEQERFRMLLPLIGAAAGAGVGYLYGKRDSSADDYVPAGLFSIPVGALAGFVVGIVAEDIRSQLKDDADRER
ncbi:MAG TPA: hypothetical protein VK912_01925 [Longimicrobiales bacterium]|nr:hypothetical protein [Longimicrobiales bacterium]